MAPVLTDDFAILRLSRKAACLQGQTKSEIQRPVIHKIELLYWLHLFVHLKYTTTNAELYRVYLIQC